MTDDDEVARFVAGLDLRDALAHLDALIVEHLDYLATLDPDPGVADSRHPGRTNRTEHLS